MEGKREPGGGGAGEMVGWGGLTGRKKKKRLDEMVEQCKDKITYIHFFWRRGHKCTRVHAHIHTEDRVTHNLESRLGEK